MCESPFQTFPSLLLSPFLLSLTRLLREEPPGASRTVGSPQGPLTAGGQAPAAELEGGPSAAVWGVLSTLPASPRAPAGGGPASLCPHRLLLSARGCRGPWAGVVAFRQSSLYPFSPPVIEEAPSWKMGVDGIWGEIGPCIPWIYIV